MESGEGDITLLTVNSLLAAVQSRLVSEWCSEPDIILGNYSSLVRYLDWIIGKLPAVGSNMIPSHSSGSSFHSDISIRVLIHFKSSIATTMKIAIHSYFPHFVNINQFYEKYKKV